MGEGENEKTSDEEKIIMGINEIDKTDNANL